MTILVDQARWPWRDTLWCHLVSDDNLAELHAFAGRLGARRVGFQGDHYDIDIETREVAIAQGATPCDSREMIRRMRAAGLRLRPSTFTKWDLVKRSHPEPASGPIDAAEVMADPVLALLADRMDGWFMLSRVRDSGDCATAIVVVGSQPLDAGELPVEALDAGLFSRIDHTGTWSVERIHPPPTDIE